MKEKLTLKIYQAWNRHGGQWFARIKGQKKAHRFPGPVLARLLGHKPDTENFYELTFYPGGIFDNPEYTIEEYGGDE